MKTSTAIEVKFPAHLLPRRADIINFQFHILALAFMPWPLSDFRAFCLLVCILVSNEFSLMPPKRLKWKYVCFVAAYPLPPFSLALVLVHIAFQVLRHFTPPAWFLFSPDERAVSFSCACLDLLFSTEKKKSRSWQGAEACQKDNCKR